MEEMKKNDFVVKPCTTCGNPVNIDMERIKQKD